jgi:nicotinamide-nucleotide amidase
MPGHSRDVGRDAGAGPVAEALCIGDELLSGDTVNGNAAFLGTRARSLGVPLVRVATVRDRVGEIVEAVRAAADRCDVLFVSGGLGPTTDDLTTEALAAAAGVPLVRDDAALERLADKFRRFARAMPEANHKQADFPQGAEVLANPIGTAEGFALALGRATAFVMPGVPRELQRMTIEQVEPRVRARFGLAAVRRRVYRVLGLGESALAEKVEPIVAAHRTRSAGLAALFLHYRAAMPEVTVVLEATADAQGNAASDDELVAFDAPLFDALAPGLYGVGEADLATRSIDALRRAGLRVAFAESCTGGLAAATVAAIPGASDVLLGGVVAYDDRIKRDVLGVPADALAHHGAVSEPVARALAEGVRRVMGSDLGVGITGIAGPGGGTAEKPVGTVHIAIADAEITRHLRLQLRGDRGTVQRASALWSLKLAWDRLVARGLASVAPLEPIPRE